MFKGGCPDIQFPFFPPLFSFRELYCVFIMKIFENHEMDLLSLKGSLRHVMS